MDSTLNLNEVFNRLKVNFNLFLIVGVICAVISFFGLSNSLVFKSSASVKVNNELYESTNSNINSIIPFQSDSRNSFETEILQILQSRDFIIELVQEKEILVRLVAKMTTNENAYVSEFNEQIYNGEENIWVGDYYDLNNGIKLERYHEIKENFMRGLEITKLGNLFYEISYESQSPELSYDIVSSMIYLLNEYYRSNEIKRVKKQIALLETEYKNSQIVELKSSITNQISQKIEKLVTLNSLDELALITIDSTSIDKYESAIEKRFIYDLVKSVIVFFFFIFLSIFYAFLGYKIRLSKNLPYIIHEKF